MLDNRGHLYRQGQGPTRVWRSFATCENLGPVGQVIASAGLTFLPALAHPPDTGARHIGPRPAEPDQIGQSIAVYIADEAGKPVVARPAATGIALP